MSQVSLIIKICNGDLHDQLVSHNGKGYHSWLPSGPDLRDRRREGLVAAPLYSAAHPTLRIRNPSEFTHMNC